MLRKLKALYFFFQFFNTWVQTHASLKFAVTQNQVGWPWGFTLSLTLVARNILSRKSFSLRLKVDIQVLKLRISKSQNL